MPAPKVRVVDADRLLYHYLQKDLLKNDIWLFQMFTARLVVALGIWLPSRVYERLPVLLPYAVRDPASRGNKRKGIPDSWGAPNELGYFRDDNSLVKTIPRALSIISKTNDLYGAGRIGRGFVACHVWRELSDGGLASRNPLTYSFVPNLVWLPSEVAALTDREGSFVQSYTQALAQKIFRAHPIYEPVADVAESAWALLPSPPSIPDQGLPDIAQLNFFEPTPAWFERRLKIIRTVVSALDSVAHGRKPSVKVVSDRYTDGLVNVPVSVATALRDTLRQYVDDASRSRYLNGEGDRPEAGSDSP